MTMNFIFDIREKKEKRFEIISNSFHTGNNHKQIRIDEERL